MSEKIKDVFHIIAMFAMPIVTIFIGYEITGALGYAELRAKNFETAISILTNDNVARPLRDFAVDVLAATTPEGVELSEELKEALRTGTITFPAAGQATGQGVAAGHGTVLSK